jgi:hypothetical protein
MRKTQQKKAKLKFSIPYNGDMDLIRWAVDSGQVGEVYFSAPEEMGFSNIYQSLRLYDQDKILYLTRFCKKNKIKTNLLINKNLLYFEDISLIFKYIFGLIDKGYLNTITVSDPFIVPYFRKIFPEVSLQSSIFMGINNCEKVMEGIKMGINDFCLDPSVNRNFSELKRINDLKKIYPKLHIKLLGIHGCYLNCFFAWRHTELPVYAAVVKKNKLKLGKNVFANRINVDKCFYKTNDLSDEIKRPIIRPEDLSYYEQQGLADFIKVAYRNESSEFLRDKLTAYFKRSYSGNFFYLFESNRHKRLFIENKQFPSNFINTVMNCNNNCNVCDFCNSIARHCVRF